MSIVTIKITGQTETKLDHIRGELDNCRQSATFDETLIALMEVAEDHPDTNFRATDHVKAEASDPLLEI